MEELGKIHPFAHLQSEAKIQKNVGLILKLSLVCHALFEVVPVYTKAVGADTLSEDGKFASSLPCVQVCPFPLWKCVSYYLSWGNGMLFPNV